MWSDDRSTRSSHSACNKWIDSGAQPRFQSWGIQFFGLGYCTEQNTDGIPSFVDYSLLRNGNHILIQKSWGGPSKFWGSRPPSPPSGCALELTADVLLCGAGRVRRLCGRRTVEHVEWTCDDVVDLDHMRVVKCDRHDRYARDHGMTSYFVSAKTGESVSWHRSPCCCCCLKFNIVWPFRLVFTTGVLAASYTIYVWKLTTKNHSLHRRCVLHFFATSC